MSQSADPDLEVGVNSPVPDVSASEKQGSRRRGEERGYRYGMAEEDTMGSIWKQVMARNEFGHYNFERFESMQLLNLCLQQHELRVLADEIYAAIGSGTDYPAERLRGKVSRLKPMLKEYNEALIAVREIMGFLDADFKTISPFDKTKVMNIPRLMTDLRRDQEQDRVRKAISAICPRWLRESRFVSIGLWTELKKLQSARPYTRARVEAHERAAFNQWVDLVARIIMAFFGGASLLIPMIIMIFAKSVNVNLIVTSVFVLFFGLILALGSKASNQEILAATAGYAAVLVVFIGTSGVGG